MPVSKTQVRAVATPPRLLSRAVSEQAQPEPQHNWWTLVAVCGATFMLLVDITIVNVALPAMHDDLHASFTQLQWVLDAYSLSLASLLLTYGTLADRFGRKVVFVTGVGVFTLASLLCGVAQSGLQLDLARAFQGLGGAAMFTTALALIAQDFTGRVRGTAIAYWGATVGGAVAVGPVLGGALTEASWRWIFFVNLPVGAAVLAIAAVRMTNRSDPHTQHLDLVGLVTLAGSLFLFVFALLRGNDKGWSSALILGLFAGAVVLMAAFAFVELRQERPMFDLTLLRNRDFGGVSLATFAIGCAMFAAFPYLTLYLQNLLGYSPFQGGLRVLPSTVLVFLVPIVARRFGHRIRAGLMLGAGMTLVTIGLLLMTRVADDSRWTVLLPGMLVAGVGIGLANPAIAQIALAVVAPNRSGMASGISNTFRIGGVATGIAALGAVLQHEVGNRVIAAGPRNSAEHHAFVTGTHDLLVLATVIAAVGALAAFALIRDA
jgi:EmrB/QacA subfamily drug resistance transporter